MGCIESRNQQDFSGGSLKIELTTKPLTSGQLCEGFVHVDQTNEFKSAGLYLAISAHENVYFD